MLIHMADARRRCRRHFAFIRNYIMEMGNAFSVKIDQSPTVGFVLYRNVAPRRSPRCLSISVSMTLTRQHESATARVRFRLHKHQKRKKTQKTSYGKMARKTKGNVSLRARRNLSKSISKKFVKSGCKWNRYQSASLLRSGKIKWKNK